jgi:hypothetical protein
MDFKHQVIVRFVDEDHVLYWKTSVTHKEENLLRKEVEEYVLAIERLMTGKAPGLSYQDPNDANRFLVAKDKSYHEIFQRPDNRAYYEDITRYFDLVRIDEPSDEADEYHEGLYEQSQPRDLVDILINPYSGEEFSLGYRVLPLTQSLIDSGRFK